MFYDPKFTVWDHVVHAMYNTPDGAFNIIILCYSDAQTIQVELDVIGVYIRHVVTDRRTDWDSRANGPASSTGREVR